jgi:ATP-binding cassette subfamily B protein RaxB
MLRAQAPREERESFSRSVFARHRLPVVLQVEAAECGLACMAMIAQYYGSRSDLSTLRQRFAISLRGMTLADLVRIGAGVGLTARALRVETSALARVRVPAILHWDLNHYVVLSGVSRRGVHLHDPAVGRRIVDHAEFGRHFTGVVLEITPTPDFAREKPGSKFTLGQMLLRTHGLFAAAVQVFVFACALELVGMLLPFATQWIVDGVLRSGDRALLFAICLAYVILVGIQSALYGLRGWSILYLSTQVGAQWMVGAFSHLLRLPLHFFEKRHLGDVVSRFDSIRIIQKTITAQFVEAVLDGLMGSTVLIVLLLYSAPLASVVLATMLCYAGVRGLTWRSTRSASAEFLVKSALQSSTFLETMRGIQAVRVYSLEQQRKASWYSMLVAALNRDVSVQRLLLQGKTAGIALFGAERAATLALGALAVLDHRFSVGMFVAYLVYKEMFVTRVSSLIDKSYDLRLLDVHVDRLSDIMLAKIEAVPEAPAPVVDAPVSIAVENVSFRYSQCDHYAVRDVSFFVPAGKLTAITGRSGCGKTTLAKVILGLLQPENGCVKVNDYDLARYGATWFRDILGSVMQEDVLFAGSLADNISLFDPSRDMDRIIDAAGRAAIHRDIMSMPMRYESLVGDMGTALSGGQRQRVLLARALYRRPAVLLLDEATSSLDLENERLVSAAVAELNMTRIVIAHRRETIAAADHVIEMHGGRILA